MFFRSRFWAAKLWAARFFGGQPAATPATLPRGGVFRRPNSSRAFTNAEPGRVFRRGNTRRVFRGL